MKTFTHFLVIFAGLIGQEITVAFGIDKPPYTFTDQADGIEYRIVKTIFERLDYPIKTVQYSFKRLQVSPLKYEADVAVGVNLREDGLFYSDGFMAYHNVAISKEKKGYEITKIGDLLPFRVGAWSGAKFNLGDEYWQMVSEKGRKGYYEYPSQNEQNIAFWRDYVDVIILDRNIFLWYREMLKKEYDTSDKYIFHEVFSKNKITFVSFRNQAIRDGFNEELRKMRESGEYQKIIDLVIKNGPVSDYYPLSE